MIQHIGKTGLKLEFFRKNEADSDNFICQNLLRCQFSTCVAFTLKIYHPKKYNGVGGHLFATACDISSQLGYGGAAYGDAANKKLIEHYCQNLGLLTHRAEALDMCITKFNEKTFVESIRAEGVSEALSNLVLSLMESDRSLTKEKAEAQARKLLRLDKK